LIAVVANVQFEVSILLDGDDDQVAPHTFSENVIFGIVWTNGLRHPLEDDPVSHSNLTVHGIYAHLL